ncbi:cytochrome P450 [Trichodelitschia bisporula]|uniref:Cytochrome P450 n=1 Tax=Trichodelitschia bisporula TaxID=703511 RepID=A0A6G1I3V5_9PEZI|nr:cytochrome P450 [Trichodelitschia bisporula]
MALISWDSAFRAAFATVVAYLIHFIIKLFRHRRQMMGLPGPPYHPILGHLPVAIEMARSLPPDVHPHHYWAWLKKRYNLGPFYYFDAWPMGPPTLIICEPEVADHVTVKHNLDKHPMVKQYLKQHLGTDNMAAANGIVWKRARTVYNPGFATSHLMTVIASIVDDVVTLSEVLGEAADSSEVIQLETVAMKLSFDVIGRLVLGVSLGSQRKSNVLVDAFRRQLHFLSSSNTWASPLAGVNPLQQFSIWRNARVIDGYLGRELDERFAKQDESETTARPRTIIDVALRTYNEDRGTTAANMRTMDAAFRRSAIDQIKTFVFAGHDTISTTISMLFYYLSTAPHAVSTLRAELSTTFPPTTAETAARIRADPYILNSLPYATACIKETLRLFPPANTVRIGSPSVHITDPGTGATYPTLPRPGTVVWPDAYVLGRDDAYFPRATEFLPERWLPESPVAQAPVGAWRPFERGPRNCIGSEFGVMEVKVVVALCAREFEFEAVWPEGVADVDGERCYQMLFGSAKPKGGVPGRMKRMGRNG